MLPTEIKTIRKESQIQTFTTTFIKLLDKKRKSLIKVYITFYLVPVLIAILIFLFSKSFFKYYLSYLLLIWGITSSINKITGIKKDSRRFCFIAIRTVLVDKKITAPSDMNDTLYDFHINFKSKRDLPILGKDIETQLAKRLNNKWRNRKKNWPISLSVSESVYHAAEIGMPISILVGLHSNYWCVPELGKNYLGSDFF